jgi:pyrimidine-nucleoside phosphorylase
MVALSKGTALDVARKECHDNLKNGKAYAVFAEMVKLHGGDLVEFERIYTEGGGASSVEVLAPVSGFISDIDAETVARAAFNLGAGRAKTDDAIDMSAGVLLSVVHGDRVEKGQTLAKLFAKDRSALLDVEAKALAAAFTISENQQPARSLIIESIVAS